MSRRKDHVVKNIEKAFTAYSQTDISRVSFAQLKDWINSNTKDGISSPRLASFLRQRSHFKCVERTRTIGTNLTETYWVMEEVAV